MGLHLLIEGATVAASVGMGCGTCCGSSMGLVLSGYLMTHAKNFGQSFKGFLSFYLGKIMAVMALCGIASLVGEQIMDDDGYIVGIPIEKLFSAMMAAMGIWFIIRWFREGAQVKAGCAVCDTSSCGKSACGNQKNSVYGELSHPALFLMGAGYGISPCAPLLMMIGYSITLPLWISMTVGAVFAVVSAISPMLLLLLLSGILAGKAYLEMPTYLRWFRLCCYILMLLFFGMELM